MRKAGTQLPLPGSPHLLQHFLPELPPEDDDNDGQQDEDDSHQAANQNSSVTVIHFQHWICDQREKVEDINNLKHEQLAWGVVSVKVEAVPPKIVSKDATIMLLLILGGYTVLLLCSYAFLHETVVPPTHTKPQT